MCIRTVHVWLRVCVGGCVWQCWWGGDKALERGRWGKIWDKVWNVSEKGEIKTGEKEGEYQSQRALTQLYLHQIIQDKLPSQHINFNAKWQTEKINKSTGITNAGAPNNLHKTLLWVLPVSHTHPHQQTHTVKVQWTILPQRAQNLFDPPKRLQGLQISGHGIVNILHSQMSCHQPLKHCTTSVQPWPNVWLFLDRKLSSS